MHPDVVGATVRLLAKAGARRVRLLESPMNSAEPLEEFMLAAGWEPRDFQNLGTRVEFENTNYLGYGKKYARFMVPGDGLMYKGYDLNHSYEDCDVFVSLAKLKEHFTAGVTLSMKNCFGMTPCTIYGDGAPADEPGLLPQGGRGPFHAGNRVPPKSAPQMINPNGPKEGGIPRAARGGGPGGGAARASGHHRWHPIHDRRRGSLDSELPAGQAGIAGGGNQLRQHRCGLHGADGI